MFAFFPRRLSHSPNSDDDSRCDYLALARALGDYLSALAGAGVTPLVIVDGMQDAEKEGTTLKRRRAQVRSLLSLRACSSCSRHVHSSMPQAHNRKKDSCPYTTLCVQLFASRERFRRLVSRVYSPQAVNLFLKGIGERPFVCSDPEIVIRALAFLTKGAQ